MRTCVVFGPGRIRGLGVVAFGLLGLASGCGAPLDPAGDSPDPEASGVGAPAGGRPPPPDSTPAEPGAVLCGDTLIARARPTAIGVDAYTLSGLAGESARAEGSCGGAGRESVLAFVAPAAGYWTFAFDAARTAFVGVVHLRSACDDADTELACSIDPTRGWQLGVASAVLEAGETVSVFVDSAEGRGGAYTLGLFRTDAPVAPTVTGAQAFAFPDGRVSLRVAGTDPDGDVKWVRYTLLDAAGTVLDPDGLGHPTRDVESERPTVGLGAPIGVVTGLPAGVARIRVALVDATDAASPTVDVPVVAREPVGSGAVCDADGVEPRCDANLVCLADGIADPARCVEPTTPEVVDARAYRAEEGLLTFALAGADTTRDAVRFVAALLPADDDTPLVLDADGGLEGEISTQSVTGLDVFDAQGSLSAGFAPARLADFPGAARARITLVDAQGRRSAPVITPIVDLPVTRTGEACDPWRQTDRCESGAFCFGLLGDSEGECRPVVPPALDTAAVSVSPGGVLRLTVRGHRTEYTPLAVDVALLPDASEEAIDLPDLHSLVFFPAVDPQTGAFTLDADLVAGPTWDPLPIRAEDYAEATRLRVVARDVEGLVSPPMILALPRGR
ncbi:hypothetical protein L6V77_25715 [Myxococcota bacterium]|nr:hypothetical protein [Myxococcota bacterium]